VVPAAFAVAVYDPRMGGDMLADEDRREQFPLLLGMEVAVDVGEIPTTIDEHFRVADEPRRHRPAEGRRAEVPRVVILDRVGILSHNLWRDDVFTAAAIQTNVHFIFSCARHETPPFLLTLRAPRGRNNSRATEVR